MSPARPVHERVWRRLARRADSEHEQALVRIAVVSLLVLYVGALAVYLPDAIPLAPLDVALYGLGYLAIGAGYLGWILASPRASPSRRILAMVTDQTNVAVLIALGGAWGGALYPIYLWITFGNGFRFGNAYLAAAAGYSALTFVVAASFHPFWLEHIPLTVGLALGLLGLPAYGASLISRLTEAKRAAEAASHAKSRFLATMSHELRTPLNAVIGLSDMLRDGRLDRDQDDMAATINTSGRALLGLINDILDHAKIESGNAKLAARDFDLAVEIANIVAIVRPQAKAKGLGLGVVVDADIPARVHSDPACLRHILLNLLANALKFTEAGGAVLRVRASHRPGGHALVLAVADTGIGIAPENRARIFETFTQSEEDRGRRHEGSGLGLAIARQLADLMGGDIAVASTPGAGSTFTVTLPVANPADAAQSPGDPSTPHPANAGAAPERDLRARPWTDGGETPWIEPAPGGGVVAISDPADPVDAALIWNAGAVVRLVPPVTSERRRMAAVRLAMLMRGATGPAKTAEADADADADAEAEAEPDAEAEAEPDAEARADPSALAPAAAPATMLVVEDNAVNRKVTAKILTRAGHTAVTAESGEAALDRIAAGGIDAVLMDVNMPDSSGLETTQLYRYTELGGSARLPIIALTADATEATRNACRAAGMDDYIAKPAAPSTVVATLVKHLPGPRAGASDDDADPAATPDPGADQPILDAHAVATLRTLDPGGHFLWETVETFLAEATTLLDAVATRLAQGDLAAARDELHALKSAAGNVGAARLRARIRALDADLAARGSGTCEAVIAGLRRELDAYRDAMRTYGPGELPHTEAGDAIVEPMSRAG